MHTKKVEELFGQTPKVFRNTELIYSNELGAALAGMRNPDGTPRFKGDAVRGHGRAPGVPLAQLRLPPARSPTASTADRDKPVRAAAQELPPVRRHRVPVQQPGLGGVAPQRREVRQWVHQINGDGYLCNLFMDYETFGEHQWADTGIFQFLDKLPEAIFDVAPGENHFITPERGVRPVRPVGDYDVHEYISWADTERDLTAWRGNAMQWNALEESTARVEHQGPASSRRRRRATTSRSAPSTQVPARGLAEADHVSDHFYYMCTKFWADGDVHKYFSPYDSPYDGYINFMNVLDNMRTRICRGSGGAAVAVVHGRDERDGPGEDEPREDEEVAGIRVEQRSPAACGASGMIGRGGSGA
jgi:alpha-amylase